MTPEQRQKQKLKYYARRIIRNIKNDAPDVIIALDVMLLWQCAEATIGLPTTSHYDSGLRE